MKLYRFRYSPYARKVQMVLDLLGKPYELVEVPYLERDELARLTGGYIHVPVLVDDDGRVVCDSRRICEHLLDGAATPLVTAERVSVRYPLGAYRGKLDDLDITLEQGVVSLVREGGRWTTMPAAWTRSTPGAPPRSLPAFAALRLRDVAVVYDRILARKPAAAPPG